MIDLKALRQLVKLMVDNELSEMDLSDGDEKVKLKRGAGGTVTHYPMSGPMSGGQPVPMPTASPAPAAPDAAPTPGGEDDDEATLGLTIDSPMVGSFYSASSPDAAAFVGVGDKVGPETVVCIIEAMKVFNEIKAETSGTVTKVLVNNGDAVEFGQPLFEIKAD